MKIFCSVSIELINIECILIIENRLKDVYKNAKITNVKGDNLIFEFTKHFNSHFDFDEIESIIYNSVIAVLNVFELKILKMEKIIF